MRLDSVGRRTWERLAWSDWLYVQRMVDELDPIRQSDGRWRFASPGWLTAQRRSVGFVLVAELIGDSLTPVTFYRVRRQETPEPPEDARVRGHRVV